MIVKLQVEVVMNCKYARTACSKSYHVLNSTWSAECAGLVIELVMVIYYYMPFV